MGNPEDSPQPPFKKKKWDFPGSNGNQVKDVSAESSNNFEQLKTERRALPIFPARQKLVAEIRRLPSVIVIGETGSGKTTQIPQFIVETGVNKGAMVAVTQPRRVAAISVAKRVAQEKNSTLGSLVGYSVRFEDVTSHATKIKFMTDGMLLREAMIDKNLSRYNIVILDEAHERTVHTDVLFGIVKTAQRRRLKMGHKLLKIIVMSATMDVDHFSDYFNKAEVLYLEGRQYPVKVMYAAVAQSDYVFASLVTLFQIHKEAPAGEDVLIFLTGQDEIEMAVNSIRDLCRNLKDVPQMIVHPLYAALNSEEQIKVFNKTPSGCRKVVVATNIAETSITIHGIKFVIDSGMVKAKLYNPHTGLELLKVVTTSKAQTLQRMGRAGREMPGVCYCLYTEKEFNNKTPNTIPEIQRCNLGSVVLQMMAMGISNVLTFDFMDKPSPESIKSAVDNLIMLGALERQEGSELATLTPVGRQMAAFPLDPRFSKAIILAREFGCLDEMLSIIAVLSVDPILVTSANKRQQAQEAHQKFLSSDGDHMTLLNIYHAFKGVHGNKDILRRHPDIPTNRAMTFYFTENDKTQRNWCFDNFISARNMNKALEVRKQMHDICQQSGMKFTSCGRDTTSVRRCLASALFMDAAELTKEGDYITLCNRTKVFVHPNSALFGCKPACVVYTELVKTSKCYMRDVSLVDPDWLLEAAPAYFKRKKMTLTFNNTS